MNQEATGERTPRQWEAYVASQLKMGQRAEHILFAMREANWPEAEAREFIRHLASKARRKAIAIMTGSGLVGLLALVITITSVQSASTHGGTYFVWYGGIIAGAVGFIWGLVQLAKIRG